MDERTIGLHEELHRAAGVEIQEKLPTVPFRAVVGVSMVESGRHKVWPR